MFLFLLLDGGQHLARLGVAELKHGGVVHAGDIFFRAQQIGQQIGVALFFSAAGRGFQVLFRLLTGGLPFALLALLGGQGARQHTRHGVVMALFGFFDFFKDMLQLGVAGIFGGLAVLFHAQFFFILQVLQQALLLFCQSHPHSLLFCVGPAAGGAVRPARRRMRLVIVCQARPRICTALAQK